MKIALYFLIGIHGIIHLFGFLKAFGISEFNAITQPISKTYGIVWLLAFILFTITTVLLIAHSNFWWIIGIIGVIISQFLILNYWSDAKYGTILNIIVLLAAITSWATYHFEMDYKADVKKHIAQTNYLNNDLLTESDLAPLPFPVQKYIRYTGAVNKPKVKNMKVIFDGEMRDKGKEFFKFNSEQYNFFDNPTRLFFMKANMYGTTLPGYHRYENARATMQIKLLGLFNVVNVKGTEMNIAETVTVFNDMCLMAPASMIDKRIEWTSIDSLSAKATFTNGINKITALLYFNEQGQLINFISDDRYVISDMKQYRFSTPIKEYAQINGRNILKYGETIWHYPDGEFVYGKFTLKSIEYNVSER